MGRLAQAIQLSHCSRDCSALQRRSGHTQRKRRSPRSQSAHLYSSAQHAGPRTQTHGAPSMHLSSLDPGAPSPMLCHDGTHGASAAARRPMIAYDVRIPAWSTAWACAPVPVCMHNARAAARQCCLGGRTVRAAELCMAHEHASSHGCIACAFVLLDTQLDWPGCAANHC